MSYCMNACKTISVMCAEAQSKGKKIIRINKIWDLVDNAIELDLSIQTTSPIDNNYSTEKETNGGSSN